MEESMRRTGLLAAALLAAASFIHANDASAAGEFYVVSHGGEGEPFWTFWLEGVNAGCTAMNVKCNISFHKGDVASHKEALNAAIAAGAAGIVTTSAEPGLWVNEVKAARDKGIHVVFSNTDDPNSGREAYVGANLVEAGTIWAKYLVDNELVKGGDKVFMPVEVAGATYGVEETKGIAGIFDPLGIKYEVVETGLDPAGVIAKMSDYLIANPDTAAIIGLGDMVTSLVPKVFDGIGKKPGDIPVVGWGNSIGTAQGVVDGYINAGLWQYPFHQGYMPIVLLNLATQNQALGYNITTLATYDKSTVGPYLEQLKAHGQ
jgi:simple sugar transport system substrate-binding protein